MGKHQETIEVTSPEDGEIVTLNITSLVSDVRDLFLSKIRNDKNKTIWSKMSEADQKIEIEHAHNMASEIVSKVASLVACGQHAVIHALLDNYKVKDGGVTVTAKGIADDGAVLALNHVGKKALKIIVVDEGQFDQDGKPAEPDPDQYRMNVENDDDGPSLADAMQDAIEADTDDDEGDRQDEEEDEQEPETQEDELIASKPELTPYEQGQGSAKHGMDERSNPFDGRTADGKEWLRGHREWMDANQPDQSVDKENLETADEPNEESDELPDDATLTDVEIDDATGRDADWYREEGAQAFKAGKSRDDVSYDGGTSEFLAWQQGFDRAKAKREADMEKLRDAGAQARKDGAGPSKNPWKPGSSAHKFWLEGYQEQKDSEPGPDQD
jgi:hypothetical protein